MDVSGQLNSVAALSLGRTPVFITQGAGRAPEPVWTLRRRNKSLVPTGIPNAHLPASCQAKTVATLSRLEMKFNIVLYFHKIFKSFPSYTAKLCLVQILMLTCPRIYSSNLIKHKRKLPPCLSVLC